ncbi:MAG TPA: DUF4266 domain-containing protein [Kofleriaceae bacterium]
MPRVLPLVVLVMIVAGACVRVPAHQRGRLAARAMQAPVWPELTTANEHVFTVREGTGGANGAGGGGCGCN